MSAKLQTREQMLTQVADKQEPGAVTLLPCPFCGGEGDISFYARTSSPEPAGHFVECLSCAASGPSFEIEGAAPDRIECVKSKAITAWNTRLAHSQPVGDKRIVSICDEAARANEVIRLNRHREWQGMITVATALHRIEKWANEALATHPTQKAQGDE